MQRDTGSVPSGHIDSNIRQREGADTPSHPRGMISPGWCIALALDLVEGAGKAGRRLRPQKAVCDSPVEECTRTHEYSQDSPAFPAQWVYGLYRALPGERRCLPPSRNGPDHPLDATVAALEPHGFAVRLTGVSSGRSPRRRRKRPSQPAPKRTVAIMIRPSGARDRRVMAYDSEKRK
jgi:hypothetical protein